MDQIVSQRQTVRDFWSSQHGVYQRETKIDLIYDAYVQWLTQNPVPDLRRTRNERGKLTEEKMVNVGWLPPINRYIFRTLIRKMGYKNGHANPAKNQPSEPETQ